MEENKVSISLDRYDTLLLAETQLELVKQILFNENNTLVYNKKHISFEIETAQVELVFPFDYKEQLAKLQEKEGINV